MLRRLRSGSSYVVLIGLSCRLIISVGLSFVVIDVASAQAPQPNVVLFLADDMGWTDWQYDANLNPSGSVVYETPNLLRLANESVNFRNAYAAAPVCSPTRSSILTGKSPARSRMTDFLPGSGNLSNLREPAGWLRALPVAEVTLAESLKGGGYATGFFGKWHLGPSGQASANPASPQNGFDVNVGGSHFSSPDPAGGYFAGADGMWAGMPGMNTLGEFAPDKFLNDALADRAGDFIAQQVIAETPFFLSFWDYAPHITIQAPASLVAKYQTKISTLQGMGVDLMGHTNPTYAAIIETIDNAVGRLLNRLDDPNGDLDTSDSIRNNTIFIFTSDNGGVWGSSGSPTSNVPLREGKGSLYEGGIREPLMISWTGNADFQQGSFSDARTSTYDLYPTVLDLTGLLNDPLVPKNTTIDGITIRDALEGGPFDRGHLYWHYPHRSPQDNGSTLINGGSFVSAVLDDDWKLLFFYEDRHYELYNLEADISETTNLLAFNPGLAHELSQSLNGYLSAVNAQMPVSNATGLPVALPPVLTAPLAGDYNGDGFVTVLDYETWKTNYGSTTHLAADGNGNRRVDAADYTVWRNLLSLGSGAISSSAQLPSHAVPEPASLALLLLGASLVAAKRLRRRPAIRTRRANRA